MLGLFGYFGRKTLHPRGKSLSKFICKGLIIIIEISREESLYLRKVAPAVTQTVCNRHAPARKKTHLIPNESWIIKTLEAYRKENHPVVGSYGKRGRKK